MMSLHPEKGIAYLNAGWVKFLTGNYLEALKLTEKSLELEQQNIQARFNIALIHLALGNISKSKQLYKTALRENKKFLNKNPQMAAISALKHYCQEGKYAESGKDILKKLFKEE
jgi:tetratricopeptide (TPR) repeat protein